MCVSGCGRLSVDPQKTIMLDAAETGASTAQATTAASTVSRTTNRPTLRILFSFRPGALATGVYCRHPNLNQSPKSVNRRCRVNRCRPWSGRREVFQADVGDEHPRGDVREGALRARPFDR